MAFIYKLLIKIEAKPQENSTITKKMCSALHFQLITVKSYQAPEIEQLNYGTLSVNANTPLPYENIH